MAPVGPFTLSAEDLARDKSPPDVAQAVALLQSHGFVVLRAAPLGAVATFELTSARMAELNDQEAAKRVVRNGLAAKLGELALGAASMDVRQLPAESKQVFEARLYIARPTTFAGIGDIL